MWFYHNDYDGGVYSNATEISIIKDIAFLTNATSCDKWAHHYVTILGTVFGNVVN